MTGAHRDTRLTVAELLARLGCFLYGHDIEQTGHRAWHCTRCDRCAKTPVELP